MQWSLFGEINNGFKALNIFEKSPTTDAWLVLATSLHFELILTTKWEFVILTGGNQA